MKTEEVLDKLQKQYGIEISDTTLRNYVKWELIPHPLRGGLGRGKGRTSEYQDSDIYEIVATYKLLNGKDIRVSPDLLKNARKKVLVNRETKISEFADRTWGQNIVEDAISHIWRVYVEKAKTPDIK